MIASFFDHKTKETKSLVSAETPSVFLCLKGIKDPVLHFYRTTTQSLVFDSVSAIVLCSLQSEVPGMNELMEDKSDT